MFRKILISDNFRKKCIIDLKVPAIFQEKADFAPW